jgi:hypothetical protein
VIEKMEAATYPMVTALSYCHIVGVVADALNADRRDRLALGTGVMGRARATVCPRPSKSATGRGVLAQGSPTMAYC